MTIPGITKAPYSTLSAFEREEVIREAQSSQFDLIVIGGGATGAGIALDAAVRGLKTILVEKTDFAAGTSSRSTKLIHGGLRYLKQMDIQLVREVGKERAIVHQNAPHLVHPEELILPIIENGSLGKYTTPVGLWMYEKLAGVPKKERFHALDRKETLAEEQLLNKKIVKGGAIYREYRTDDSRLVISLIKTAAAHGAICINYLQAQGFTYNNDEITGLKLFDTISGSAFDLKGTVVVNAAGPWCDEIRSMDSVVKGKRLQLTKGAHIVFDRERFPIKRAVYFDVLSDKRMVFAIPRGNTTYLGTTDTLFNAPPETVRTSRADADYLLVAANYMFPDLQLTIDDIQSSWAGVRPLIYEDGKDPSELSRKDEVFHTPSGLISIAGGKLTGYRKMAERVVDMVVTRLASMGNITYIECSTDKVSLTGGNFKKYKAVKAYRNQLVGEGRQIHLSKSDATYLVGRYGKEASSILEIAYHIQLEDDAPELRLLKAEIWYAVTHESVYTLSDFLIRRTGRLYFYRPNLRKIYTTASLFLAEVLDQSEDIRNAQLAEFETEFSQALEFT